MGVTGCLEDAVQKREWIFDSGTLDVARQDATASFAFGRAHTVGSIQQETKISELIPFTVAQTTCDPFILTTSAVYASSYDFS
ncbi:hypothetical protein GCM10023156_39650 [Novipirellula rosea]|uniref:Uncharacterized protein n=1 Tax=Novipirellula rosea TaxID=1031540 RepID=A0ABP8N446_9BACT